MRYYIALDGGTSNTRLRLLKNGAVVSERKLAVGAATADGGAAWSNAVAQQTARLLEKNGLCEADIASMIASGMLTSEYGPFPLPHLFAPAGLSELAMGCADRKIEGLSIPVTVIPGVKCIGACAENSDMMRGEEAEIIGLLPYGGENCTYILPGTHSKHARVDENGKITDFTTFMTGEMIGALAKETILRDAVTLADDGFDPDALLRGYDCAVKEGISAALFKTRIMKNLFAADPCACYSFFLGALLSPEILHIASTKASRVLVAGKASLRLATEYLLQRRSGASLAFCAEEVAECASAFGAVCIYEEREKFRCLK